MLRTKNLEVKLNNILDQDSHSHKYSNPFPPRGPRAPWGEASSGGIHTEDTHMRLAGIEKGGYYPYPPLMAEATASWFTPLPSGTHGRLLDPCAGEGEIACFYALHQALLPAKML